MRRTRNSATTPVDENDSQPKHTASTMDGRENELIALAYDAAEKRIREGTASSQEIVHFLKLGSGKERMEREQLEADIKLKEAKIKALEDGEHLEQVYQDAIDAMKKYSGNGD